MKSTPFAIPGLMRPVLSPEVYKAVSVVDELDMVLLEMQTPAVPPAPRVELRSRGGIFLHRENLAPQFLISDITGEVTRYRLKWPVDVPPNDYELHVQIGNQVVARIAFNVAAPPAQQLQIRRQS